MHTSFLCRQCLYVFSSGSRTHCPVCESKELLPVTPPDTEENKLLPESFSASRLPNDPEPGQENQFLIFQEDSDDTGAVTEYYTTYPFGEVLTKRIRGEHTPHAQTWTFQYETDPDAPGYSRLKKKNYPDGTHVDYSYDSRNRLKTKCEPWEGGGHKATRITYETNSSGEEGSRQIKEFILDKNDTEFFLSETRYIVTETPLGKKEEIVQSAAGSPVRHYSSREWYGIDDSTPGSGKLKRIRDISGAQHYYEYRSEPETAAAGQHPAWTRIDTLMADDVIIPGQSTRIMETFDTQGNRIRLQEYVHDGKEFVLIRSDRFVYNKRGLLIRSFYGNGTTSSCEWAASGPARIIDTCGMRTDFEYDAQNRIIQITEYPARNMNKESENNPPHIVRNEYDQTGHLCAQIDIQGETTSRTLYTHDKSGRLTSKTNSEGQTTTYAYAPDELATMSTPSAGGTFISRRHVSGCLLYEGGSGQRTRFHLYSAAPSGIREQIRLGRINGPLESEKLTNGFGQVILLRQATTCGQMKETSFAYNEKGQKVEERTCGQAPLLLEYDTLGHLSGKVLLLSDNEYGGTPRVRKLETRAIRYCRDDFDPGDPAEEDESRQPLMYQKEIRTVYNEHGDPVLESKAVKISALDMKEGESQTVYLDKYGHYSVLDASLDPETGELTVYSYLPGSPDSASRTFYRNCLIREKKRDGRQISPTHDFLPAEGVSASCQTLRKCSFDNRGNLMLEQMKSGTQIRHEYNPSGKLTLLHLIPSETSQAPIPPEQEITVRFTYDSASGTLIQKQLMGQTTSYAYTANGLLSQIIHPSGTQMNVQYTPAGELAEISFSDGTPPILYEYGCTGRLRRIRDAAGLHDFFLSPANDPEAEEDAHTGTRLEFVRDILGRPAGQILSRKGITLQSLHLAYDRSNRIKSLRENGRTAYRFTYHPGTGALSGIAYPHGMRKQWLPENEAPGHSRIKYLFPHTQPPLIFETLPIKREQEKTEKYIHLLLTGQLCTELLSTDTGTWEVCYDARLLPLTFRQGDKHIELRYDYRGRCVEKSFYQSEILEERLCYVYRDNRLLAEFDITQENQGKDPLLLCSYIWSPVSPVPLTMTLWKNGTGTRCHYLHDADNHVRGLVDEECRLRAAYEYGEEGKLTSSNGDLADLNPFRYGSSWYDEDLGLYLSWFQTAAMDKEIIPAAAPVPPSFQELCQFPFVRQEELDKLFSTDRENNL